MSQNSNHVPVALDDWRGWITARVQELKRYYPLRVAVSTCRTE